MSHKFRYEEFTWPEIKEAVAENRVTVLPVGTIEQHGPHLPLITDVLTATEISRLAVERIPREAVLMPPVHYSFNEHHLDFPGTIAVDGETIMSGEAVLNGEAGKLPELLPQIPAPAELSEGVELAPPGELLPPPAEVP